MVPAEAGPLLTRGFNFFVAAIFLGSARFFQEVKYMRLLKRFMLDEDGQDMVEYGLVISLVVIGGVVAYQAFSNQIGGSLNTVFTQIEGYL